MKDDEYVLVRALSNIQTAHDLIADVSCYETLSIDREDLIQMRDILGQWRDRLHNDVDEMIYEDSNSLDGARD